MASSDVIMKLKKCDDVAFFCFDMQVEVSLALLALVGTGQPIAPRARKGRRWTSSTKCASRC